MYSGNNSSVVSRLIFVVVVVVVTSRGYADGLSCQPTANPLTSRQTDVVLRLSPLVPRRHDLCTGDARRTYRGIDNGLRTTVVVYGRVLDVNCAPLSNALVTLLQRDSSGAFNPGSHCSGATLTDRNGVYTFTTIKPGKSLSEDEFSFRIVVKSDDGRSMVTALATDQLVTGDRNAGIASFPEVAELHLDLVFSESDDHQPSYDWSGARIRRSWASDGKWFNRRLVPYADWDTPASLEWQRKRGWGSQDIAWLKKKRRRRRKRSVLSSSNAKSPHYQNNKQDNQTTNRLEHNRIQKWLSMLKAETHKKKWNSDSGMSWIKRSELQKKWAKDSGMSWIKRDIPEKKWAKDSGMSWIKRDDKEKKWAKDSGMSWIKRDIPEKKWAKDSGMSWIKRDDREKKWAKDSGMSWIKRDVPEKKWAQDSGMSWIKRDQIEKKWAKDSGMSWIKRDVPEKKWAKDSGMSWIKRDQLQKKWAKDSGMSWIKKSSKNEPSLLSTTTTVTYN